MTVEEKAREAAVEHGEWLEADADETNLDAYVAGYLSGHAAGLAEGREEAIAALSKDAIEVVCLRGEVAEIKAKYGKALLVIEASSELGGRYLTEIAALRAKLAEVRESIVLARQAVISQEGTPDSFSHNYSRGMIISYLNEALEKLDAKPEAQSKESE